MLLSEIESAEALINLVHTPRLTKDLPVHGSHEADKHTTLSQRYLVA